MLGGVRMFKYGAKVKASLRHPNVWLAKGFHFSFLGFFLGREVRGEVMVLSPVMNPLQQFANPVNFCSSFTVVGMGQWVTAMTLSWSMNAHSGFMIYPRNEILDT